MRFQDRLAFKEAAKKFKVWIVVRRTNPAAMLYVGLPNFIPKPLGCKAKAAKLDVPRYKLAGLVVDPTIHPTSFPPGKDREGALSAWRDFAPKRLAPMGRYRVNTDRQSQHYGCVMLDGKYIHSDYDLYDIIDPLNPHDRRQFKGRIRGHRHYHGPKFKAVMQFLNARILNGRTQVRMIQHGEQMQLDHEPGEYDMFGPEGQTAEATRNELLQIWFQLTFGGFYR